VETPSTTAQRGTEFSDELISDAELLAAAGKILQL